MNLRIALIAACASCVVAVAFADSKRDSILAAFMAQAKQTDPTFSGFSADRGRAFWFEVHTEGKIETPSCTTCHTKDPTAWGKTRALKPIAPMAVSRTPDRFTDSEKVDKWFTRNCNSVLGRPCTAVEKGDVITYLSSM
jgi:hypothetical protein